MICVVAVLALVIAGIHGDERRMSLSATGRFLLRHFPAKT